MNNQHANQSNKVLSKSQPLGNFLSFLEEFCKVGGGPGGSGESEKHIWKIFYRGDPEIGTPGTPRGSQGTKIVF